MYACRTRETLDSLLKAARSSTVPPDSGRSFINGCLHICCLFQTKNEGDILKEFAKPDGR